MTRFEANYIKYLRVRLDGSWRWVSAKYKDRYRYSLPFDYKEVSLGLQMEGSISSPDWIHQGHGPSVREKLLPPFEEFWNQGKGRGCSKFLWP